MKTNQYIQDSKTANTLAWDVARVTLNKRRFNRLDYVLWAVLVMLFVVELAMGTIDYLILGFIGIILLVIILIAATIFIAFRQVVLRRFGPKNTIVTIIVKNKQLIASTSVKDYKFDFSSIGTIRFCGEAAEVRFNKSKPVVIVPKSVLTPADKKLLAGFPQKASLWDKFKSKA